MQGIGIPSGPYKAVHHVYMAVMCQASNLLFKEFGSSGY